MCIEAGGAALGTSDFPPSRRSAATPHGATATPAADVKSTHKRDVSDVRGAFAESAGPQLGLAEDVAGGTNTLLLVLIAAALALVGTLELASRKRSVPPVFPASGLGRPRKPLLFIDVDVVSSRESIRALASSYEIVWRSSLHTWTSSSDLKLERIAQAAHALPAAVVDEITSLHEAWASQRRRPTLLVKADPEAGLSEDQVTRLLEWADTLGAVDGGRFPRTRRTMRSLTRR
jgi:hypothetical protein